MGDPSILEIGIAALMFAVGFYATLNSSLSISSLLVIFAVFFPVYVWRSYSAIFYLFMVLERGQRHLRIS